uniref:Fibronectin type-III domain-containing protein n=1 Tax=Arion vulgaris TaxID=1028688 RepID=A0A0B6ZGX7_9EUPU
MATWIVLLTATFLAGLLTLSRGCSEPRGGYKPPTLDWKMLNSDVVTHGVVLSRESEPGNLGFDVYSVQFELRCIYKGGPLDEVITISKVGFTPDNCIGTNLTVGETYIVYLRKKNDGRYEQIYNQDPGNIEYLDEIVVLCETDINYPRGYSKTNNKEVCPEEYGLDDCLPKPVVTSPPVEDSDEIDDKQPMEEIDDKQPADTHTKGDNVPYSAVADQSNNKDGDNDNGSMTTTINMSVLTCLLLSVLLM